MKTGIAGNYIVNTVTDTRVVSLDEIRYFEAQGMYTRIYRKAGEILVSKNIGRIEREIVHDNFLRIHQSTLVNIQFITGFNRLTLEVILSDYTRLKVARRRKTEFCRKFHNR